MKKKQVERSGVVRCQKCFKYGHYTYQCQNQAVYRYRPSRTMQYKQKLKLQIKASKPPKTNIVNPDYKRRVVDDGPSSDSNQQQNQDKQIKLQKQLAAQQQNQQGAINEHQVNNKPAEEEQEQEQAEQDEQSESSSSSSSSDSSSSSSSESDEQSDKGPRKTRNK